MPHDNDFPTLSPITSLEEIQRDIDLPRPTSADESLLLQTATDAAVQKALDEQRERIAADVCRYAERYAEGGAIQAILYATAHDIRSGEIGGE